LIPCISRRIDATIKVIRCSSPISDSPFDWSHIDELRLIADQQTIAVLMNNAGQANYAASKAEVYVVDWHQYRGQNTSSSGLIARM